jgi:hypothetical protein
MDADQGQQATRLPVAGPEDLVVPVGLVPAEPFLGVGRRERLQEPRLQPLALLVEEVSGMVDVQPFERQAERPSQDIQATTMNAGSTAPQLSSRMVAVPIRPRFMSRTFIL